MARNYFSICGEPDEYLVQVDDQLFDIASALRIYRGEHFKKEHIAQVEDVISGEKYCRISVCVSVGVMYQLDRFPIKIYGEAVGKRDCGRQIGTGIFIPVEYIFMTNDDGAGPERLIAFDMILVIMGIEDDPDGFVFYRMDGGR